MRLQEREGQPIMKVTKCLFLNLTFFFQKYMYVLPKLKILSFGLEKYQKTKRT